MKNFMMFLLLVGQTMLCTTLTLAQSYPFWLNDPNQKWSEYPTSIASAPDVVATVGFYEDPFDVDDLSYSTFWSVPCFYCNNRESIFVNWREEGTSNTWTALISARNRSINNQVNVQSTPQVDIASNGDVYVSFSYNGSVTIIDASNKNISTPNNGNFFGLVVVKFNHKGDYQWHITERGFSNTFITDLDYNEKTGLLAIAGYLQGSVPITFSNNSIVGPGNTPSVLGTTFPYGNSFAAMYQDKGNSVALSWVKEVGINSYSSDIVQDDAGYVFLSGMYSNTSGPLRIANLQPSGLYSDGNLTDDYFIVKFEPTVGTPIWAETYGGSHNELTIAPDKRLRYSSLAIIPQSSELFYAFVSAGSDVGNIFNDFGTYINSINPSNGAINSSITAGYVDFANTNSTNYPQVHIGTPTYNPSIAVDENRQVYITGNFLLTNNATSAIGIGFEDIQIGSTLLTHNMTNAMGAGASSSVGWYTAMVDFGSLTVYNEQLNSTYVPVMTNNSYNQLPVYGIAQEINHSDHFYHILGFNYGALDLDLSINLGVVNNYDNTSSGSAQYDGLIMRNYAKNGQISKRTNVTNTTQSTATSDKTSVKSLGDVNTTWILSPNPVTAGQSLLWKSERGAELVHYIRLMDMTGRLVQEWKAPQATAQGFQLPIGNLVAGTYLLEASGADVKQSTIVVVK